MDETQIPVSWELPPVVAHRKQSGRDATLTTAGSRLTDVIRDGQLDGEGEESTAVTYRKVGNVSIYRHNGETRVNRGVSGRGESAGS